ncbi:CTLH/CRAto LisH motif domain-containing protein [Rozella allomycis CSF55]|uniref:CTLH/CRAto LisH motif domain-containing protein n=1 Tax=Rozella allomycis (strain CSF55) TaxID=988480 RepID=A0A075AYE7_ROZAC|nr:CTLH/CRAto LisH motif domain-containing protein [Rozella allomycis CSF55]|eukprot:EPZ35350.1 CTLH/CRAto LisH motif domain-containing protein [Rozella allomycis CSF55]
MGEIPYEQYKKQYRQLQKVTERDLQTFSNQLKDIPGLIRSGKRKPEDIKKSVTQYMKSMKKKVDDIYDENQNTTSSLTKRIKLMNCFENIKQMEDPDFNVWTSTLLERLIVDYLLRNDLNQTANHIYNSLPIKDFLDLDFYASSKRIALSLKNKNCSDALVWCSENKTYLKKTKSDIEFQLRFQEYVELCSQRKISDAISYCKKYLIPWRETHLEAIQRAAALIAFSPSTSCPVYKKLYETSRWDTLVSNFYKECFKLVGLPESSFLITALEAGLSSLKTSICSQPNNVNINCPVCNHEISKFASKLPCAHHINSRIVCRISGLVMDEHNPPLMLPNGKVYSTKALTEMANVSEGKITCPRTGSVYQFSDLRKCYVL